MSLLIEHTRDAFLQKELCLVAFFRETVLIFQCVTCVLAAIKILKSKIRLVSVIDTAPSD